MRMPGSLFYVNGSHAEAVNDRWSFKLSAGYFTQDPLPRPSGTIPNALQTPYPSFTNEGTSQPKFDARVDYDIAGGGIVSISGGVAGTEGLIHTGIGPFDISSDTLMTYLSTRYQKGWPAHRLLHEPARRRRVEPSGPRADRAAVAARVRHQDLRRRGVGCADDRHATRADVRRQLPAQHVRHFASRPMATIATRAAGSPRTRSFSATTSAGSSAAAWTSSRRSRIRCSRRGRRSW